MKKYSFSNNYHDDDMFSFNSFKFLEVTRNEENRHLINITDMKMSFCCFFGNYHVCIFTAVFSSAEIILKEFSMCRNTGNIVTQPLPKSIMERASSKYQMIYLRKAKVGTRVE